MQRFYFDYNATSPPLPEALEAYVQASTEAFGNSSSIHWDGQNAKRVLEQARLDVAKLLGASAREIVFVSGGTEANNLALFGAARTAKPHPHIVTSGIEHPAVLNACVRLQAEGASLTVVDPGPSGIISPESIQRAIRPETVLVSVMHVNNELGTIQPIREIAQAAHAAGALFHADGVQAAGRIPIDVRELDVDLYSISGHKLGAPRGTGALYVRKGVNLTPMLVGGRHENGMRAGTENVAGAAALACACRAALRNLDQHAVRITDLRDRLERGILASVPGAYPNGDSNRAPNVTNIAFRGLDGEAMVIALDLRGFAVSSGSACSSGAVEPSHVLTAIGLSKADARSSLRFSLGPGNDVEQVDALIAAVSGSAAHLLRIAPKEARVALHA